MALEQAQQLFDGAAKVDYASRPILLYYGLSQATRALAAAAEIDGEWVLHGHGLHPR